jgi:hypothetical protein
VKVHVSVPSETVSSRPSTSKVWVRFDIDYLGVWRPEAVGKQDGGDLNRLPLTYPLFYALQVPHPYKKELQTLLSAPPGKRDLDRILEILDQIGAPQFMLVSIEARKMKALNSLGDWASPSQIQQMEGWWERHFLPMRQTRSSS